MHGIEDLPSILVLCAIGGALVYYGLSRAIGVLIDYLFRL